MTTAELIRRLFEGAPAGGVTTKALAERLLEMLPREDFEKFAVQGAQTYVRQVLRQKDALGLPLAGRSYSKLLGDQYCWLPRSAWTKEDYEWNVKVLDDEATEMLWLAERLRQECQEKFGRCDA